MRGTERKGEPCPGYGGPCGKPTVRRPSGVDASGYLCMACAQRTHRAWLAAERPYGDCHAGCGRPAYLSLVVDGVRRVLCRRCYDRYRATPSPHGLHALTVRSFLDEVRLACKLCGTTGGPSSPTARTDKPVRYPGGPWGLDGYICGDCHDDLALADTTAEDDADYLPTPEQIRAECAEIRRGWDDAEREARLVAGDGYYTIPWARTPERVA
jgi:hypothetical protein